MAKEVFNGRYTVPADGADVTVFLIGMRINKPWQIRRWAKVAGAMPRMLRHLGGHPEAGMLGFHNWFGRTTVLLSYWKSPEHLRAFAADPNAPHAAPWRAFMKEVGASGDVGVWHETYVVRAGDRECIYANMPLFGLAAATSHVKVGEGRNTARQRLRSEG
ncbi:DUF4188 domain-containing protein [Arthrobacter sp. 35W]|uniref:DUF4188 domain-containing protein n=1 Tax=Arthrobacter sp. 35W TaxID=1132441 RepID=UPI00047D8AE1|nr:DUF4188 domain-containing protein [Arthrobacter sp. 35W]